MLPPEDVEVLEQLRAAGDVHWIERPVVHWFFGEEADLRTIGKRLSTRGWSRVDPRQHEDGWLMSPTKLTSLSEAAIMQMNAEIADAAENLDVTYDGWETSVEKPN